MRVELDHVGARQSAPADLIVDRDLADNLVRVHAWYLYLARGPSKQISVVEVDLAALVARDSEHILRLRTRRAIGLESLRMGRLRLDQQIMTGWIMLFADGRPPAVGGSDIDHCTDFELTARQAPEGAVRGHAVKRDDFRWLGNMGFEWLGRMGGRGWGAKSAGDQLFERIRPNLSEFRGAFPGLVHELTPLGLTFTPTF